MPDSSSLPTTSGRGRVPGLGRHGDLVLGALASDHVRQMLKTARERAGLTGEEVAHRSGISQSKVSKIESGTLLPDHDDVQALAGACGASDQQRARLAGLVAQMWRVAGLKRLMLHRDGERALQLLEHRLNAADQLVAVAPLQIPLLLRTEGYALAALGPPLPAWARTALLQRLTRRRQLLDRQEPVVHVVVFEAALRTTLGSPAVMAEQLHHLLALAQ